MKLSLATLAFVAPAAAFAPTASFGARPSALQMSTETEAKVRLKKKRTNVPDGSFYVMKENMT
eukprot:CAMPEP_0204642988 /NCGR_PEP_ID=MMETSP0718-20130828/339_1 /ASSEMBLY_ACC=CAM_ASM_000674 /TAXON_ID=230516 /ORGANISM="Chaetoceros curvisetus" /LENGTH=62 /DNA_ID=CAMNT_0051664007 /DNA_START=316 /DNA_END=504 /DNA_ORIENTATION=+